MGRAALRLRFGGILVLAALAPVGRLHAGSEPGVLAYRAPASPQDRVNRIVLRRDGALLELLDGRTGALLASRPYGSTSAVVVEGADGEVGDTLAVDFSGGSLSLPGGIRYDGGTGGFDTLELAGGTFAEEVHRPSSPNDGVLTLDGLEIVYTNIEPIIDLVPAASLTVSAGAGNEIVNIVDAPVAGRTQVNFSGGFESMDFSNKTALVVNALGGVDTITVDVVNPATGLATITVDTGPGNDDVFVRRTPATVATTITGTSGADSVTVGDAGSAQGILGALNVAIGSGGFSLTIDDSVDLTGRVIGVNNGSVTGLAPVTISHNAVGIAALTVNAGTGADVFTVNNTANNNVVPVLTTLNGGGGADSFSLLGVSGFGGASLVVDGQGGGNSVNAGNGGTLQSIAGPVTVRSTGGTALVTLDASAELAGHAVTVTATSITGIAPVPFSFPACADIQTWFVHGGAGSDTFDVTSTCAGAGVKTLVLNGNGSGDVFNLGGAGFAPNTRLLAFGGGGDDTFSFLSLKAAGGAAQPTSISGGGGAADALNYPFPGTDNGSSITRAGFDPVLYDTVENLPVPVLTKSFAPAAVPPLVPSTLTFTLTNQNALGQALLGFTDTLPAGMQVAPTPAIATTCAPGVGAVSAAGGAVTLTGASLAPGQASCTVSVNVQATACPPATLVNSSTNINPTSRLNDGGALATLGIVGAAVGAVTGGGAMCAGGSSTVTVTVSGGIPPYTVTLDNGGGTQSGSGPGFTFTVSPAGTTTYSVASLTDSLACAGSGSGSATVTVNPSPSATITAPASVCAGTQGNLASAVNAGAGATYLWTISSGVITAGQGTPTIAWAAGTASPATLHLTVTSGAGCTSSSSVTVALTALPTASISAPASTCVGTTATATVTTNAASPTYYWSLTNYEGFATPAGPDSGATFLYAGTAAGRISVECTVTDGVTGCRKNASFELVVTPQPAAPALAAPATAANGQAGLTGSVPANAGSTYAWTIANGTITAGAGTPVITFTAGEPGVTALTVVETSAEGCVSPASTATVLVGGPDGPCVPGSTTLCLNGSRFKLEVSWKTPDGQEGQGQAVSFQPVPNDSGTFWFFDAANVELIVKVLDGRAVNGSFWVMYGALSDVEYTIQVTDTRTGETKTYTNPQGTLASVADIEAFVDPPRPWAGGTVALLAPERPVSVSERLARVPLAEEVVTLQALATAVVERAACAPGATTLCLNAGRFEARASWDVPPPTGTAGVGYAVPMTTDTGTFWFFAPTNTELAVKVLDGTAVNGKYWVFYGALSDVHYRLEVRDTVTGAVKVYENPRGTLASVADVEAFTP